MSEKTILVEKANSRCIFVHQWSRWADFSKEVKRLMADHQWHQGHEAWQARICLDCGKRQDRRVVA